MVKIKLENICKTYNEKKINEVKVLENVSVELEAGKMYAIMGESGTGKSTLINILGLLDNPTSGNYYLEDYYINTLSEKEKAILRNQKIGFIFQSYFLINELTALENVYLPTIINPNIDYKERKQLAINLLDKFGLKNRINHHPKELSGGECQRVALARALINNPNYIIADEPTGNLDAKNEEIIFEYLKGIAKEGKCVIIVTHNAKIKNYCDDLYLLQDGGLKIEK